MFGNVLFLLFSFFWVEACSMASMNKNIDKGWRFFTERMTGDGVCGHVWCWAELDTSGCVARSASGFYTIISAMLDARAHGFPGPVELGDPELLLDDFGDRRAFTICTS